MTTKALAYLEFGTWIGNQRYSFALFCFVCMEVELLVQTWGKHVCAAFASAFLAQHNVEKTLGTNII